MKFYMEELNNLDRVEDLTPIEDPVMADAQQFSKKRKSEIDKILKSADKVTELKKPFTGSKNQPTPKNPETPKLNMSESIEYKTDSNEILEDEILDLTNNFKKSSGAIRVYSEKDKDIAKEMLDNFYNSVEVSDGRTNKDDGLSWVISFTKPSKKNESFLKEDKTTGKIVKYKNTDYVITKAVDNNSIDIIPKSIYDAEIKGKNVDPKKYMGYVKTVNISDVKMLGENYKAIQGEEDEPSDDNETAALKGGYDGPITYKEYTIISLDKGRHFKVMSGKNVLKAGFKDLLDAKDYINDLEEDGKRARDSRRD